MAQTILNKIKENLKSSKKYTTLEVIAAALTAEAYGKDTTNQKTVTFKTFKLGVDFKKVDSAPLDDKLYLVARTMLLDGKQVTISIKEKDGIIKGSADAVLPVLEITEEQMEQKTPAGGEVPGTEKTEFSGTVKDNLVKIPIHLRPKSEEELKQWKDKISKGKEDGTYTYTFGSATNITNETQKASTAKIILTNAQKGNAKNPKIEEGKTSSIEEIGKVLTIKDYKAGDTITFKLLKKVPEFLYLHAKAQGEKQHDKKFLNKEGAYFQIGKKCDCEARVRAFIRMLRVGEGTGEMIKSYDKKEKKVIYISHDFQRGYTTAFAGHTITDLSTHPQLIYKGKNDKEGSSAAGAYQVMRYTWWELAGFEVVKKKKTGKYFEERDLLKKYKIPDYTTESQDKICIALMQKQRENLLNKIIANKIREAIQQDACYIWASLPENETESHYYYNGKRQPATPLNACIEHYNQFLEEELKGNSNLHLKEGFLKDFDIKCCNNSNESSGVCPEDRSQCFEYSDVVSNPRLNNQSDNVNKNRWHRTKRYNNTHPNGYYHTGTDILASSGTTVSSILCGTVYDLVKTFTANEYRENSLGNYVIIKSKDKNGDDVYIKYCHLDEVSVVKNQKVKHGDAIGQSGSTGNAASVYENGKLIHGINPIYRHIHIEAATSSSFGTTRIDPEQFMKTKFDETTKGNPT
ncbi:Peptidase family M23 [Chryseobacterium sp. YR221]|nr:Peptidase family M23 [Chryseobacterium sp. YR221]